MEIAVPDPDAEGQSKGQARILLDLGVLPTTYFRYLYSANHAWLWIDRPHITSRSPGWHPGYRAIAILARNPPDPNRESFSTQKNSDHIDSLDVGHPSDGSLSRLFKTNEEPPQHAFDHYFKISRYHDAAGGSDRPTFSSSYVVATKCRIFNLQRIEKPLHRCTSLHLPIRNTKRKAQKPSAAPPTTKAKDEVLTPTTAEEEVVVPSRRSNRMLPHPPKTLSDLPPELLHMIISSIIPSGCIYHVLVQNRDGNKLVRMMVSTIRCHDDVQRKQATALLYVCKTLSANALSLLFARNTFILYVAADELTQVELHTDEAVDGHSDTENARWIRVTSSTFCRKGPPDATWPSLLWPSPAHAMPHIRRLALTITICSKKEEDYTKMLSKLEIVVEKLREAKNLRDLTVSFRLLKESEVPYSRYVYNISIDEANQRIVLRPPPARRQRVDSWDTDFQFVLEPLGRLYGIPDVTFRGSLTKEFAQILTSVMSSADPKQLPGTDYQAAPLDSLPHSQLRASKMVTRRDPEREEGQQEDSDEGAALTTENFSAPTIDWAAVSVTEPEQTTQEDTEGGQGG